MRTGLISVRVKKGDTKLTLLQTDLEKDAFKIPKFVIRSIPQIRQAFKGFNPFKKKPAAWGWGVPKRKTFGTSVKEFMVGEPSKFMKELQQGKAFSRGSMMRKSMTPSGPLDAALLYGFPAYETYHAAKGPAEGRAARIGGALGGSLWLPTFRPLGLLGSSAVAMAGHGVGSGLGKLFDKAPPQQSMQQPRYY